MILALLADSVNVNDASEIVGGGPSLGSSFLQANKTSKNAKGSSKLDFIF
jgi:hypothetical protein